MKVVATRSVCYEGVWYKAGESFDCNPKHFASLEAAGVETYKEKKSHKKDRAVKDFVERS